MSDAWSRPRGRLQSFKPAFSGLWLLVSSQPNARIHLVATLAVVAAGMAFGVSPSEWVALVLAVTAVWVSEAANTALELLGDAVSPDFNATVGKAKDVAAASVLLAAIGASVVGALVLGPYLLAALG